MREVVKNFPDDLDAATLFAESGMNLHPWGLWHVDGTPEEGTEEVVATLESVIKRDPDHMGAVHYYIHAVEASRSPQRALAAANKLAAMAPAAGHLVHMPAHVYIRTGDYEAAVKTNQMAATADRAYIKASGVQGIYPMMYYSHNLHFIAMCAAMNGNYPEAKKNADMLRNARGAGCETDASAGRLHDHSDCGGCPLSQVGFDHGDEAARQVIPDHDRVLALRSRNGAGRQREVERG